MDEVLQESELPLIHEKENRHEENSEVGNTNDIDRSEKDTLSLLTTQTIIVGGILSICNLFFIVIVITVSTKIFIILAIYISIHLGTVSLAYYLRDSGGKTRWLSGFICAITLSVSKTIVIMPGLVEKYWESLVIKMLIFGTTALWECSNAVLVFGGSQTLHAFNITSFGKAAIAGLVPCQIKFVDHNRPNLSIKRSLHLLGLCILGLTFRECLRRNQTLLKTINGYSILEAEALAIVAATFVLIFDIPGVLWQIGMDCLYQLTKLSIFRVVVIFPYGAVYFCTSMREFWRKWSRPGGALIRHMVYYPLGGGQRPWLSIPLLFLINASCHYDVGKALVGDRAEKWWNMVFGVLGLAVTFEVISTKYMERWYGEALPVWFKIMVALVSYTSSRFAVFVLTHSCLKLTINSFL